MSVHYWRATFLLSVAVFAVIAVVPASPEDGSDRGPNAASDRFASSDFGYSDISLERNTTDFSWSNTVSVGELSEKVQKRSSLLQKEALRAIDRGDNLLGEQLLRRALEMTPSAGAIYNNLGVSFLRRHNFDEAALWFERAVKVAPYDPQLLGNLGIIRWAQLRTEESYRLIDRAAADGFSTPAAHYILGIMSLEKGEAADAIKEFRKSDPDRYPRIGLYLSIALDAKGKSKGKMRNAELGMPN